MKINRTDCGLVTRRSLVFIFILLYSFLLSTLTAETVTKVDFLSKVIQATAQELSIPSNSPLYIEINYDHFNEIDVLALQEQLLKMNFTIVHNEQFSDYIVTIKAEESLIYMKTEIFPKREMPYLETTFFIQVTQKEEGRILSVDRHRYIEATDEVQKEKEKWYTPFFIAFVLGSLVYLLFYGN